MKKNSGGTRGYGFKIQTLTAMPGVHLLYTVCLFSWEGPHTKPVGVTSGRTSDINTNLAN